MEKENRETLLFDMSFHTLSVSLRSFPRRRESRLEMWMLQMLQSHVLKGWPGLCMAMISVLET